MKSNIKIDKSMAIEDRIKAKTGDLILFSIDNNKDNMFLGRVRIKTHGEAEIITIGEPSAYKMNMEGKKKAALYVGEIYETILGRKIYIESICDVEIKITNIRK